MTEDKKEIQEKPLDKMTVTELREIAKDIPDVTGVTGMKKAELLEIIKADRGIEDAPQKKTAAPPEKKTIATVKELKAMIKALRSRRAEALAEKDKKMARIYRRRISRLKKKTRRAA